MSSDIYPFYARQLADAKGARRLLLRLVPVHVWAVIRSEWHLAKVRLMSRVTSTAHLGNRLLLNIGSGPDRRLGWVNVDIWPAPTIDVVYDCRKHLPFVAGSARCIFTEHFFEHLDYTEEVPSFLAECRRVLETRGVLRIVVPDAERYVRAYCSHGWTDMTALRSLGPDRSDPYLQGRYETKMELLNAVFHQGHEHKFAYDFETLAYLLKTAGFSQVIRQDFGKSIDVEYAIDRPERAPESLYVEAVK
jgi:predicted SAM-dependent methyltransferase